MCFLVEDFVPREVNNLNNKHPFQFRHNVSLSCGMIKSQN